MNKFLVALTLFQGSLALYDVPLGECHGCEVTCFEDCSLKYDREIMADDFLQVQVSQKKENRTQSLKAEFGKCLEEDKCPCEKEETKASLGKTALVQKKKAFCPIGEVPCARKCGQKVIANFQDKLRQKSAKPVVKKQVLIQKDYPIHSVRVGVFSKGAMNMDQCIKFCLAATCGCDKAPGLDDIDKLFKAIKQNDAAVPGEKDFSHHRTAVKDTHQTAQFRPAKIGECAKGMIGKKVNKGLYIDMGDGVGGELEICSDKFLERLLGPGDHSKQKKLCQSTKSDDTEWGCVWNEVKGYCSVGFSPNLRCQKKFFDDPSRF
jgi:hypothetical protein